MSRALQHRAGIYIAIGAILALALGLRLFGHDWDQGHYLHPDERFIAIVLSDRIHLPKLSDIGILFDPAHSPLNPRSNDAQGHPSSFAYGSLPLYLTGIVAWLVSLLTGTDLNTYAHIASVGRYLSTLLDVGTVLLAFVFARRAYGRLAAVLTGFLLATSVILIQLAHFFTTDAWVTFVATATLVAALQMWRDRRLRWVLLAGAMLGAALATKVSVLSLAAPILVAAFAPLDGAEWPRLQREGLARLVVAVATSIITFAIFEPYAILAPGPFLNDAESQWSIVTGRFDVPYTRQYVGTIPGIYQIENLVRWGLGPALGIAVLIGFVASLRRLVRVRQPGDVILVCWICVYFASIAFAEAKFLRYLAPIVPALVMLGAAWLASLVAHRALRSTRGVLAVSLITIVLLGSAGWAAAFETIYTVPPTRVAASQWIYSHIPAGKTITAEYWDDALPLDLHDRAPSEYKQLTLDLYADRNNQEAFDYIASALNKADYIILSSNRLADSIPRLPWRYPVTSQYYQLLESGQLGFQLVYQATDYPRLGPFTFPDQSADESFSVYDHPEVRIYKKVTSLSRTQLQQRFAWALAQPWSPTRQPPNNSLLLPKPVSQEPAATDLSWSRGLTHNSLPAALVWLVALAVIGLLSLPLTLTIFRGFSELGWGFARLVGLLLVGYVVWIAVNLGLMRFELPEILPVVFGVGLLVWYGLRSRLASLIELVRERRRTILISEAIFLSAFAFFLLLRAINPDLWQTYFGGEKPMEMAYTSAIARSATFPPYDPWYAGGVMNYYYYGFYLVALLWKLTGIPPEIGFQLAIATVAAVLATGIFSLASTLARDLFSDQSRRRRRWIVGGGLAGVVLFLLIGNLDAAVQILSHRNFAVDFWAPSRAVSFGITEFPYFTLTWADLHPHAIALSFMVLLVALVYVWIRGCPGPSLDWTWLCLWTGLVALVIGSIAVTNSWDTPIAGLLAAAALATRALSGAGRVRRLAGAVIQCALIAGGAYLLFRPFFSRFVVLVSGIQATSHGTAFFQYLDHFGIFLGILLAAGLALLARRLLAADFDPLASALGFLAGVVGFVIAIALTRHDLPSFGIILGALLLTIVVGPSLPLLARVVGDGILPGPTLLAAAIGVAFLVGLLAPFRFTAAFLLAVVALGALLWYRFRADPPAAMTALCLTGAAGVTFGADLIFIVDDLNGSEWERMNTIFKFYFEAWTLFAVAALVALLWLFRLAVDSYPSHALGLIAGPLAPRPASAGKEARGRWLAIREALPRFGVIVSALLILAGLAYPVFATGPRLSQRMPGSPSGLTLNGLAWMPGSSITNAFGQPIDFTGDYEAIQWLRAHGEGLPVILEASIGPYRGNGSRISAATGFPDVLGWDSHELQQRYATGIEQRLNDVRTIYQTTDLNQKLALLEEYDVRYVIVGDVERLWTVDAGFASTADPGGYYAGSAGLSAFNQMVGSELKVVFQADHTTVYEVLPFHKVPPAPGAEVQG